MSDDAEYDTEDGSDSNLVKDLRKQLKAAKTQSDEFAAVVAEFNKGKRATTVAAALTLKGARPELAKFYTAEDASDDAVGAWVLENAELFGIDTDSGVDAETAAAADAISRATGSAPATKIGSNDDILHALKTLTRAQLVEKGLLSA